MDDQQQTPPGWYPRPSMPGSLGYWDGQKWTDHVAPEAPPAAASNGGGGVNVWVIAVGVLVAAVVAWFVYAVATADDDLEDVTNGHSSSFSG